MHLVLYILERKKKWRLQQKVILLMLVHMKSMKQNQIVTHHMTVSMNPTWLGDTQPRYVKLDGDILEITSPPIIVDGKEQNTKLIWKRVK